MFFHNIPCLKNTDRTVILKEAKIFKSPFERHFCINQTYKGFSNIAIFLSREQLSPSAKGKIFDPCSFKCVIIMAIICCSVAISQLVIQAISCFQEVFDCSITVTKCEKFSICQILRQINLDGFRIFVSNCHTKKKIITTNLNDTKMFKFTHCVY